MIEVIFALLMYMNGKLEGYSPKDTYCRLFRTKKKSRT
jgi:hypothetical protein